MSPGFRYHIATIAAVFLALGVGIVIGSSFVQSPVVERLARQVGGLRAQYDRNIGTLTTDRDQYRKFAAELGPWLLTSRLTGKRVALVQTGDYPDTVRQAREAIEQAGGTVSNVTTLDQSFSVRAETNLKSLLPKLQTVHPNVPATAAGVIRVLAVALARGDAGADLQAMDDANLITREGDYGRGADYIVVVGGATVDNGSRADTLDLPLVTELKDQGARVVEVESRDAEVSYIPSLADADITTVDNADTDIGRIALVLALNGERGNYGVKKTAQNGVLPRSAMTTPVAGP